ncbi:hypothetical protein Tco_0448196 [Tanacetum coccineum]
MFARYGHFLKEISDISRFSGRDYELKDDQMDNITFLKILAKYQVEDDVVGDHENLLIIKQSSWTLKEVQCQGGNGRELNSMKVNEVWIEVDPPPNTKVVRSKWLFKKKPDMDGEEKLLHSGELKSIEIRSKRLIGLSQSAYIDKILKKFNMHNSKKGYLPMKVKHELSNEMCASTPEEADVACAQTRSVISTGSREAPYGLQINISEYLRNTRDKF